VHRRVSFGQRVRDVEACVPQAVVEVPPCWTGGGFRRLHRVAVVVRDVAEVAGWPSLAECARSGGVWLPFNRRWNLLV